MFGVKRLYVKVSCLVFGHPDLETIERPPSWVSKYAVFECPRCGQFEVSPPVDATKEELKQDYEEAIRVERGAMFVRISRYDVDFDVFTDMEKEVSKQIKSHFNSEYR